MKKLSTKQAQAAAIADMKKENISARVFNYAKRLHEYPKEVLIPITP